MPSYISENYGQAVRMVRTKGHDGVEAYVDNILVFSKTYEKHLATLKELFGVLMEANISLRMDKCAEQIITYTSGWI